MSNERYQFHNLLSYPTIAHGVSSKTFGPMVKLTDGLESFTASTVTFARSVGIDQPDIVCMNQIHSGKVYVVKNASRLTLPETDGLITSQKHLPLAVRTADCLPVLFYDPKNEVIGVAHAGYKGLLNNILENMIQRFVSDFKSDPKDILIGIGPSIEMKCYQVGDDRIEEFRKAFPAFKNMFTEKGGKFYLDLRAVAQQCLKKEGILKEHIEVMNICTKCDENFYSYRRGDRDIRFASVISLV
jgi:polyphenol oxidase